jgi:hypothetical protein
MYYVATDRDHKEQSFHIFQEQQEGLWLPSAIALAKLGRKIVFVDGCPKSERI